MKSRTYPARGGIAARFVHFWRGYRYAEDCAASRFLFGQIARTPLLIGSVFGRSRQTFDLAFSGECLPSLRRLGHTFVWKEAQGSGSARWFVGTASVDDSRALWLPLFYFRWATYRISPRLLALRSEKKAFGVSVVASNLSRGRLARRRAALAHELSQFLPVHANAALRQGAPPHSRVIYHDVPRGPESKLEFLSRYSHSLCFENRSFPGYLTEKIFDPLFVGSTPLYCGDPRVGEWFVPESYVDCSEQTAEGIFEEIQSSAQLPNDDSPRCESSCRVSFEEMKMRLEEFYSGVMAESRLRLGYRR